MSKKIRVGVFMGGKSIEHEVSFNSGRTVCDHLDTERYEIIPIYQTQQGDLHLLPWHFLHRGKTTDFIHRLDKEAPYIAWDDLKNHVDFMFLAIHGPYAEDGTIQGFLEILGIPYLGSDIFASALCMNKAIQKNIMHMHGIDVPSGIVATPAMINACQDDPEELFALLKEKGLNTPLIVKPCSEGSSLGVHIVKDLNELPKKLYASATISGSNVQDVLIEEKLSGMEFSCIVIEDYLQKKRIALTPTEIAQENAHTIFDYKQKYMPGQAHEFTPPRCTPPVMQQMQDICLKVTEILNITTFSRTDGYVTDDGRIVIFESNTLSGMGPTSLLFREGAEIGMSHTALINHLIETDLCAYGLLDIKKEHKRKLNSDNMHNKKIRVAVLMGGPTNEKEISFESGRSVLYKLSPQKYAPIPLFVDNNMHLYHINQSLLVRNATHEVAELVTPEMHIRWADLPQRVDFVFIALHGGLGENGGVQGTLEMLGLPYNGSSVLASALCMNKYRTSEFLRSNGVATPISMLITLNDWNDKKEECFDKICETFTLPCIIKPHDDGCSMMVHKVNNQNEITTAINELFSNNKTHIMIEEYVRGTELTIGVFGNEKPKALPPSQVMVSGDILSIEEKFLPGAGENQTPALLPADAIAYAQEVVEQVYVILGCKGYARIDCFYQSAQKSPTGTQRLVILEVNTLPGLTPATCIFHQAAEIGIKPMDFIDMIVTLGFELHTHAQDHRTIEPVPFVDETDIQEQCLK